MSHAQNLLFPQKYGLPQMSLKILKNKQDNTFPILYKLSAYRNALHSYSDVSGVLLGILVNKRWSKHML